MSSTTTISIDKLTRLIGTPRCPVLIDVRTDDDVAADPRLIPGSIRRRHDQLHHWVEPLRGRTTIVICQRGQKLSQGVAAWLRHEGIAADVLEGGFAAWTPSSNLARHGRVNPCPTTWSAP
jgi:rhodanese-related sulfurtransferase